MAPLLRDLIAALGTVRGFEFKTGIRLSAKILRFS
jgi:hypothetical protein